MYNNIIILSIVLWLHELTSTTGNISVPAVTEAGLSRMEGIASELHVASRAV